MHAAVRQSFGQIVRDEAETSRPVPSNCDAAAPAPRKAVLDAIENASTETISATLKMADRGRNVRDDPGHLDAIFAPGHPAPNQVPSHVNKSTGPGLGASGPSSGGRPLTAVEIRMLRDDAEDAPVVVAAPEPLERSGGRANRGAWRDRILQSKGPKAAGAVMAAEAARDLTLVVITGLPGVGKSYFFKTLALALSAPCRAELRRRVCVVSKDALSLELGAGGTGRRPSRDDVLQLVLARVREVAAAGPGRIVLMFNMNINVEWLAALVVRLCGPDTVANVNGGGGGFTLCKVVVLSPPADIPFRRLHAAAVVLACDVRTGSEPPEEASTLPPDKAWAVLSTGYFSTPNAVSTVAALNAVAPNTPFAAVHYPVPLLHEHVLVGDSVPETRPAEWNSANLVFPSHTETQQAAEALLAQVE